MAEISRDAIMVIHMDAGKDSAGKPREAYVYVDSGANVVGVTKTLERELPTFGPIGVKASTYHEMIKLGRQGNPKVRERRDGRWRERPLSSNLGADPQLLAVRSRLLKGGKR